MNSTDESLNTNKNDKVEKNQPVIDNDSIALTPLPSIDSKLEGNSSNQEKKQAVEQDADANWNLNPPAEPKVMVNESGLPSPDSSLNEAKPNKISVRFEAKEYAERMKLTLPDIWKQVISGEVSARTIDGKLYIIAEENESLDPDSLGDREEPKAKKQSKLILPDSSSIDSQKSSPHNPLSRDPLTINEQLAVPPIPIPPASQSATQDESSASAQDKYRDNKSVGLNKSEKNNAFLKSYDAKNPDRELSAGISEEFSRDFEPVQSNYYMPTRYDASGHQTINNLSYENSPEIALLLDHLSLAKEENKELLKFTEKSIKRIVDATDQIVRSKDEMIQMQNKKIEDMEKAIAELKDSVKQEKHLNEDLQTLNDFYSSGDFQ